MKIRDLALLALALFAVPALADVPTGAPTFSDPLEIDNEYFPFAPGGLKVYTGRSDGVPIAVVDVYSEDTRSFFLDGVEVECAILQETEFEDGVLLEISQNYFAQADDGAVYYFGEVVDIYEGGEIVSHEGSWLVGGPTDPSDPDDTATALVPAVFMPEDPEVGDTWKPEDLFPFVDETVLVLAEDLELDLPAGEFEDAIKVQETSALSSDVGFKWYVPGVGFVKSKSDGEALRLIASTFSQLEDDDSNDG